MNARSGYRTLAIIVSAMLAAAGSLSIGAIPAIAAVTHSISGTVYIGSLSTTASTGQATVDFTAVGTSHRSQDSVPVAADGSYVITGLVSGNYYLYFHYLGSGPYTSGYWNEQAAITHPYQSVSVGASDLIGYSFVLPSSGQISGHVDVGAASHPAAAGEVAVSYRVYEGNNLFSSESAPVLTDASGNYLLAGLSESTNHQIHFMYRGTGAFQSGWFDYSGITSQGGSPGVAAGGQFGNGTASIVLPVFGQISGHVYLGSTATPAGAGDVTVTLLHAVDNATFTPVAGVSVTVDASGAYVISRVPDDFYEVVVTYSKDQHYVSTMTSPQAFTVSQGSARIADFTLPARFTVTGHVDDRIGHPAAAGEVTVAILNFLSAVVTTTTTDAAGNFRIDQVPGGNWTLAYSYPPNAANSGNDYQSISLSSDLRVPSFVMSPSVWISGKVLSPSSNPLAGITVHATRIDTSGAVIADQPMTTQADGSYSFAHLPVGTYTVSFLPPDGSSLAPQSWNDTGIYYQPDQIDGTSGGDFTNIDATLHAGGSVAGHVVGASDYSNNRVTVEVFIFDGASASWQSTGDIYPVAGDGSYRIDGLLPDSYIFEATYTGPAGNKAEDSSVINVTASTTTSVDIRLAQGLPTGPPIGRLDSVVAGPSTISVSGWALDPDTYQSISVHIYVDGVFQDQLQADQNRPDVAAAYPGYLAAHGYAVTLVAVGAGPHTVCAYGINVGAAAANLLLGCQTVTIASGIVGRIDSIVAGPGTVTVTGWVLDRSTSAPITVHLSGDINGPGNPGIDWDTSATANLNRPDVAAAFPGYGAAHGFVIVATHVPAGARFFTIYSGTAFFAPDIERFATGVAHIVTVPSADPFGSLDSVMAAGPGLVSVAGWAADSDATAPTTVHVYVDGAFRIGLTANANRPDVGAANPALGSAHGFSSALTGMTAGTHTVCVYAINQGAGSSNPQLGCRSITIGGNPIGNLDGVSVVGPRAVSVTGWALDPDTDSSIAVHVYVDGAFASGLASSIPRADLGSAFPGFGIAHGFSTAVAMTGGTHQVCAYAINQLSGSVNTLLGCRAVSVPTGAPFGSVDSMSATPGHVTLAGWAIDPDTAAPVTVHVYVDGAFNSGYSSSVPRSDVAVAYPGYGATHGFSVSVPVSAGSHTVCVYALNQGPQADNPALSCRTVAVLAG